MKSFKNFAFLQKELGFPPFETKQWRDEYYIQTQNENIEFSVYIQMESDYCPAIRIINHSEKVEFDETITPTNLYDIEELEPTNIILNSIGRRGEDAIVTYINECANIKDV